MAELLGNRLFTALDLNGAPINGAQLTFFLSTTTTPAAVYHEAALSTPWVQPVLCDSAGRAPDIYCANSALLKLVIKDAAGVTIRTIDPFNNLIGTSDLTFLQAGAGAVSRTVTSKLRDIVNVKDFGAVGDGTTDDTAAIQAAIDSLGSNGGEVFLGNGTFKVIAGLTIAQDRIHLRGSGPYATKILFAPTAAATCLLVRHSSSIIYQGSVRDLSFYSDDATYKKIALRVVDASGYLIDNIVISGGVVVSGSSYWSGASSVGVQVCGRENTTYSNLYVYADLPLQISDNPNSTIDIDHHNFDNLYLVANAQPCVTIDTGVNLTHVSFTGRQAWVRGTDGLKWVDTTTSVVAISLSIDNVRWEQQTGGATGYLVRIEHNTGLQQFTGRNLYTSSGAASDINGIKLRKVSAVVVDNLYYVDTLVALDFDATVDVVDLKNVVLVSGSATVSISAATRLRGAIISNGSVVDYGIGAPASGGYSAYQAYNPSKTNGFSQFESRPMTVANGVVATLASGTLSGILLIGTGSVGVCALIGVRGATHTAVVLAQSDAGFFGVAAGAANYNIYYTGGNYVLQNNTGGSVSFVITHFGTADR